LFILLPGGLAAPTPHGHVAQFFAAILEVSGSQRADGQRETRCRCQAAKHVQQVKRHDSLPDRLR
jgi:hypothetical protein